MMLYLQGDMVAPRYRPCRHWLSLSVLLLLLLAPRLGWAEEDAAAIRTQILQTVEFLASDELKGREVGTAELDRAAEFLAERFRQLGLQTTLFEGTPFQEFPVGRRVQVADEQHNWLQLRAANADGPTPRLRLGTDFQPLALGGSAALDLPLVFVGYGISSPEHGYDDYAQLDVRGKAVLILRKEPQQDDAESVFAGKAPTPHAFFRTKVQNAIEHGAAAVLMVNDRLEIAQQEISLHRKWESTLEKIVDRHREHQQRESADRLARQRHRQQVGKLVEQLTDWNAQLQQADRLLGLTEAGDAALSAEVPVIFCRREPIDQLVQQALGSSLEQLEIAIDQDLQPRSRELDGWRVTGSCRLQRTPVTSRNVLAALPATGPRAEETIILGAHYDHLGMGGMGSLAPWTRAVHNGADDNASGIAVLLQVAEQLAARQDQLTRRVVFVAFSGEEMGLLGSAHYMDHPRFPLDTTVAMLNLDMVGRLHGGPLEIHGTGTSESFEPLLQSLSQRLQLPIRTKPAGNGPSDHASFHTRGIPVLHFFTGLHRDYHRPSDDVGRLDLEGMQRIAQLVTEATLALDASMPNASDPEADETTPSPPTPGAIAAGTADAPTDRPYLGVVPSPVQHPMGCEIADVILGSPAAAAGIRAGDIIVRWNDRPIADPRQLIEAVASADLGDQVKIIVKRDGLQQLFNVTLAAPR